ncbi:MAG: hypothetical protein IPM02_21145 [Betaproteobacteria bacterium]|nr:hypothetical protein [Betaproteobacteria bacterium]
MSCNGNAFRDRRSIGGRRVAGARRWPTAITPAQFAQLTRLDAWPDFLRKDVQADGNLHVYANGEIDYAIRGVHARVTVLWNFEAPPGAGDTHFSVMRGTRANLVIRQGEAESWQPALFMEPAGTRTVRPSRARWSRRCRACRQVSRRRSGRTDSGWRVTVPAAYHVGHEAHFGQVAAQFLGYVAPGALPAWKCRTCWPSTPPPPRRWRSRSRNEARNMTTIAS